MAGSLSTYLHNKLLDNIFGGVAYAFPPTLYLGLYSVAPTVDGGGTEVSASGYARHPIPPNQTNFPAASNGLVTLGVQIDMPAASVAWGAVTAGGIFDQASGGNMLAYSDDVSFTVNVNDAVRVNVGAMSFSLLPGSS